MRRLLRPLVAALLAPLLMGALNSAPLEMPEPIQLPQFTDSIKVSRGIIAALTAKKWLVEADTGEEITARYEIRRHVLRIRIDYTPQRVTFSYVDSEALDYERYEGEEYIHPNANKWLKQVGREVRLQVQRYAFDREPAVVVPVEPPQAEPAEPPPG
jgi:hypothetical protein